MADDEDSTEESADQQTRPVEDIVRDWTELIQRRLDLGLKELSRDDEVRIWQLVVEGLFAAADLHDQGDGLVLKPMAPSLANLIRHAAAGISGIPEGETPLGLRPSEKNRRNANTRIKRIGIGYASAYFRLVDLDKLVKDLNPVASITGWYDCKPSTARSWRGAPNEKQYEFLRQSLLSVHGPAEHIAHLRRLAIEPRMIKAGIAYKRGVL